jgi:hypothetical protein
MHPTRRTLTKLLGSAAVASLVRQGAAHAEDRSVTVGITLPLTGSGAEDAVNILHGAVLAIEEANAAGGAGGYHVDIETLDNGTATAGQYDPVSGSVMPTVTLRSSACAAPWRTSDATAADPSSFVSRRR